jgi:hypothetical protein
VAGSHPQELHERAADYATRLAPALDGYGLGVAQPAHGPDRPLTLAQVVHRAAEVCDPDGAEEGVAQLLARYEDRDEPVTAFGDVEAELMEGKGAIDPQDEDPAVSMTVAVAVYLAHRRTELGDDPEELLRLAARSEFDGTPPEPVADWLAARGVDV